jgi:hypothetical protein
MRFDFANRRLTEAVAILTDDSGSIQRRLGAAIDKLRNLDRRDLPDELRAQFAAVRGAVLQHPATAWTEDEASDYSAAIVRLQSALTAFRSRQRDQILTTDHTFRHARAHDRSARGRLG